MATMFQSALVIRFDDSRVGVSVMLLKPAQQRRTKVETDVCVIIDELFVVAGFAACFQSAMHLVARSRKIDLADSSVTAEVDLGSTGSGTYGVGVRLLVSVPALDAAAARDLAEATEKVCPYSNATRGNIPFEIVIE